MYDEEKFAISTKKSANIAILTRKMRQTGQNRQVLYDTK
jgi:hypothetical protein